MKKSIATGSVLLIAAISNAGLVPTKIIKNFNATNENLIIKNLSAIGEARLGSRTVGGATYELDTQDFTVNPSKLSQKEKAWSKNTPEAFTLAYTAATKTIVFTVKDTSITTILTNTPKFDSAWIRVNGSASNGLTTKVDSMTLKQNGVTNSFAIDSLSSPQFGFDANALYINGLRSTRDFTIGGNLTFDWTDASKALNSRGAIQIKVGQTTEAVPEPATLAVLGAGAAVLRRKKAAK